jgi:hypothetical protein
MTDKKTTFGIYEYANSITLPTEPYPDGAVTLLSHLEGSVGSSSPYFVGNIVGAGQGITFTGTPYSPVDQLADLQQRVQKLESAMDMWKSAAITLAEMNRELQAAAEADRDDRLTLGEASFTAEHMMLKNSSIGYSTIDGVNPVAGPSFTFNLATGEAAETYDPKAITEDYYFGGAYAPNSRAVKYIEEVRAERAERLAATAYEHAMKVVG